MNIKTLNLARREYSDIDYKIYNFPDGQKQINIKDCLCNWKGGILVISRITNGDDLFLLMQVDDILSRSGIDHSLFITYLMGARCDRLFSYTQALTIDIVTKVLNDTGFKSVSVLEPHSDRSCRYRKFIQLLDVVMESFIKLNPASYVRVFPDKGSSSRYNRSCYDQYIICDKTRSVTGELSKFLIKETSLNSTYLPFYLVDDLCDGGGTFLGLNELLRNQFNPSELNLVVTHAIQKSGIEKVSKVYDNVFITNSFYDWDKEELPSNVKIFNIFESVRDEEDNNSILPGIDLSRIRGMQY